MQAHLCTVMKNKLTGREKEVLLKIIKGMSYRQAADSLFISENTIKFHVKNIYQKAEVNNRTELIIKVLMENNKNYPKGWEPDLKNIRL